MDRLRVLLLLRKYEKAEAKGEDQLRTVLRIFEQRQKLAC